jgi:hypothetical protein
MFAEVKPIPRLMSACVNHRYWNTTYQLARTLWKLSLARLLLTTLRYMGSAWNQILYVRYFLKHMRKICHPSQHLGCPLKVSRTACRYLRHIKMEQTGRLRKLSQDLHHPHRGTARQHRRPSSQTSPPCTDPPAALSGPTHRQDGMDRSAASTRNRIPAARRSR